MTPWPSVSLDEVCIKIQDGAHRSPQVLYEQPGTGRFPYLTSKNIRMGYLKLDKVRYCGAEFHNAIYQRCNPEIGDVLLTKDGANTGNAAVNTLEVPFSLLSSVCLLKPDPVLLLSGFLLYFIQSDRGFAQITGQMTGAAIKRIILKTIKSCQIPLPPLPEQERIVAILDEAFAAIETATSNAEKNLDNVRELFGNRLNELLCGHGRSVALGEVCSFENGDRGRNYPSKEARVSEGVPFVNAGHLSEGKVSLANMDYISTERFGLLGSGKFEPGDILFCLRGSLGKCGSVGEEVGRGAIASSLVIVRPKSGPAGERALSSEFLSCYFKSSLCQRMIKEHSGGAAQPNLGSRDLGRFVIRLPSLADQEEVCKQVSRLDRLTTVLIETHELRLAKLKSLRSSLLQEAFCGRLDTGARAS